MTGPLCTTPGCTFQLGHLGNHSGETGNVAGRRGARGRARETQLEQAPSFAEAEDADAVPASLGGDARSAAAAVATAPGTGGHVTRDPFDDLFKQQTNKKKVQLLRRAVSMQSSGLQVWIQVIPASQIPDSVEKYNPEQQDATLASRSGDPVEAAILDINRTFATALKGDVDILSSIKVVRELYKNKAQMNRNWAAVLLAWHMVFDVKGKRMEDPVLVGCATLFPFVANEKFSTDETTVGIELYKKLEPMINTYLYVDTVASTRKGVGTLLLQHTYARAVSRGATGVIGLAYSNVPNRDPSSLSAFKRLNFERVTEQKVQNRKFDIYGWWYTKRTTPVDLSSLDFSSSLSFSSLAMRVCTRMGRTANAASSLVWRC